MQQYEIRPNKKSNNDVYPWVVVDTYDGPSGMPIAFCVTKHTAIRICEEMNVNVFIEVI